MAGKLFMYSAEQQQFVERGYGILKINESHDAADWDRLQARLSKLWLEVEMHVTVPESFLT
jgi:hypothetical protein